MLTSHFSLGSCFRFRHERCGSQAFFLSTPVRARGPCGLFDFPLVAPALSHSEPGEASGSRKAHISSKSAFPQTFYRVPRLPGSVQRPVSSQLPPSDFPKVALSPMDSLPVPGPPACQLFSLCFLRFILGPRRVRTTCGFLSTARAFVSTVGWSSAE